MGQLQAYAALQPLERLSTHPHPEVRRGVMRALRHLFFKRTFNMIQRGLRDEMPQVRQAALEALKALHFPHAFDPLTRIFREHDDATVKEVALESIARIGSLEAGEFLVEVLRYEAEPLRQVARAAAGGVRQPGHLPDPAQAPRARDQRSGAAGARADRARGRCARQRLSAAVSGNPRTAPRAPARP